MSQETFYSYVLPVLVAVIATVGALVHRGLLHRGWGMTKPAGRVGSVFSGGGTLIEPVGSDAGSGASKPVEREADRR